MKKFQVYQKELAALKLGKCQYEWDELEELITDDFEEEGLTVEEFDSLMQELMDIEV